MFIRTSNSQLTVQDTNPHWKHLMPAIMRELSVDQTAKYALNLFIHSGRHLTGAKLIYHALVIDPKHPEALRNLSDFMDTEGTEDISAVVLEYALHVQTGITGDERDMLNNLLFLAKWAWGFSSHKSGRTDLSQEEFARHAEFDFDEESYADFLGGITDLAGSLENSFRAAHTLCGAMAGFLEHNELGAEVDVDSCFEPDNFSVTADYNDWLDSNTTELDEMEKELHQPQQSKKPWWKFF